MSLRQSLSVVEQEMRTLETQIEQTSQLNRELMSEKQRLEERVAELERANLELYRERDIRERELIELRRYSSRSSSSSHNQLIEFGYEWKREEEKIRRDYMRDTIYKRDDGGLKGTSKNGNGKWSSLGTTKQHDNVIDAHIRHEFLNFLETKVGPMMKRRCYESSRSRPSLTTSIPREPTSTSPTVTVAVSTIPREPTLTTPPFTEVVPAISSEPTPTPPATEVVSAIPIEPTSTPPPVTVDVAPAIPREPTPTPPATAVVPAIPREPTSTPPVTEVVPAIPREPTPTPPPVTVDVASAISREPTLIGTVMQIQPERNARRSRRPKVNTTELLINALVTELVRVCSNPSN